MREKCIAKCIQRYIKINYILNSFLKKGTSMLTATASLESSPPSRIDLKSKEKRVYRVESYSSAPKLSKKIMK